MQHFSLDGPVFAIVTPFQPGTPPLFDDAAYIKYLQVGDGPTPLPASTDQDCGKTLM